MTATDNDTTSTADDLLKKLRRGVGCDWAQYTLTGAEIQIVVDAIANRAVADLEAENQELRVLLADERAAHRVCVEMRDEAERKSPDSGEVERLRERCLAYKGQVEAGSIAIQHLQGEIDRLRAALSDVLRICEAVRLSAGFGKNQMERINKAKAILANAVTQPSGYPKEEQR